MDGMSRRAIYVSAGVAALVVAGALIGLSLAGGGDTEATPAAPVPPAVSSGSSPGETSLLDGIPQAGAVLGDPDAPVVLVEFADLQCPYCAKFANTTFPDLVEKYVRAGDAKIAFSPVVFIGPDSEKGLRAVYAAGLQDKLWNLVGLLYAFQGAENSDWLTDDLLRKIGARVPGLDVEKMLDDMDSEQVDKLLDGARDAAIAAEIRGTPTFLYAPAGGTPSLLAEGAIDLAAVSAALDPLLKG
jgi:protein-disulfide isomerase